MATKLLVFLFFAGLTIFLSFYLLSAISTASGFTSPFFHSSDNFLATALLTSRFKVRWKEINPRRTPGFLTIIFPLITCYFTVFLLSLPIFLSNLPVIVADIRYIWLLKPAIAFMY